MNIESRIEKLEKTRQSTNCNCPETPKFEINIPNQQWPRIPRICPVCGKEVSITTIEVVWI